MISLILYLYYRFKAFKRLFMDVMRDAFGPLPSEEGLRRRPPTGFYHGWNPTEQLRLPCTCTIACPEPCTGEECKCKACSAHYNDFLSMLD